jgi:hypothetical protein
MLVNLSKEKIFIKNLIFDDLVQEAKLGRAHCDAISIFDKVVIVYLGNLERYTTFNRIQWKCILKDYAFFFDQNIINFNIKIRNL